MKKFLVFLCCLSALVFLCYPSHASDFDFSGTFTHDNDISLLGFTLDLDSNITIFSSSWGDDNAATDGYVAGGGFDPILAIWDSSGNLVAEQDDGLNVGSTLSNGVSYSHGWWDSYFNVNLVSGDYTASIAQFDNFAAGSNLSDGFVHDGEPNFTTAFGSQPLFNGYWNLGDDPRTGDWEFHILNVQSASGPGSLVPEPSTMLLLGTGLVGLAGIFRKKFSKEK
jgi:hypothetical protein